jgi:AcrR family transcriptional regulator
MYPSCQDGSVPAPEPTAAPDPRRRRLVEAALVTFTRYGFRKTSMEEVARAAGVSRQGLYLHFATKEQLFRATIQHAVEAALAAASACAHDAARSTEDKLCGMFDEWTGRYVGMVGDNVTDLHEATTLFGGELLAQHEARFLDLVVKVIRGSRLPAAYKPSGLSARDLAESLQATARGLKTLCTTRADFVARFAITVRAMCQPLRGE